MTYRLSGLVALLLWTAVSLHGQDGRAAWLVRNLAAGTDDSVGRADVLDTPVLPGSVMKVVTLAAALESGVITPGSARMCRRVVTVDGHRYVCSHPDLKRPLTPAEALAHSCNDFFVSLAPRLSRTAFNDLRARVGLAPISPTANLAASFVGLDGPRVAPRQLLRSLTRLIGADSAQPAPIAAATRNTLREGMRGAASYGSASELASRRISALAKTGTAMMPGGGVLGLTVAFAPAQEPRQAAIVVAPGAAGRDATSILGDLLAARTNETIRVGSPRSESRTTVVSMPLEDYVARVVAGEGPPTAPPQAARALAIAARTFARANPTRHAAEGFDVCDTTHCQVLRPATESSRRAAAATAGRVLTVNGRPAAIFYSASCGGHTERPSRVWPGATDVPFLPAQPDTACAPEPAWTSALAAADIERALRAAGLKGTQLRELRILQRSESGRVTRVHAEGFVPAELTGEAFRLAVGRTAGWQWLKSTAFDLRRDARGYTFTGRGFGHGVGMCISGAACRAEAGASVEQILSFYYPGLGIEPVGSAIPVATPTPVVQLSLPARDERERNVILEMIQRAATAIATHAKVGVTTALRVTVHPTTDSFRRATRQPWWVAGATRDANIDLLPVAVLRERGILERTIRHEVAHALVDATLTDRPLWVREAAASYFAEPEATAARGTASDCPSDKEILEPASADAQRANYARADNCFRRQLASGRRWQDVR